MKFGRQLLEESGSAPVEYKGSFIKYKALKKFLKYRQLNRNSTGQAESQAEFESSEKSFLRLLYDQLKEVDRCFEREARKVLAAYEIDSSDCGFFLALLKCRPALIVPQDPMELALKARWCRRYAELNYMALRKIAKKRDRLLGGRIGEEFMQACFRGEVQARTFMSASLLCELSAIETIMVQKAKEGGMTAAEVELATERSESSQDIKDMAITQPIAEEIQEERDFDEDHTCPICLDVLYQPVSLSCGHTFCARCALAAAVGHDTLIGNAESLLLSMACYATERPCPCCRTSVYGSRRMKRSPFWDVKLMKRLGQLIKQKYPEEWERRKREDAEQQANLKADRPSAWHSLRQLVA